ncbi:hypothetical protein LOZ66_002757 [Ophidiomyces ophidiicola]|nr:hypothetical protein LOZ65_002565 [Ophidiomyces ophidiicola]KAI1939445.1 hypothetical protein LOZ66_002757 [Ophidiomyces ophidiicola]
MPPLEKTAEISDRSNDDYIAQLLTQDAREHSLRYSALGTYGILNKRPTGSAPKPNTRFLQHILRETDTHNANLKRKEEYEAREKHRQLQRERKFSRESKHDTRERESKRRRVESSEDKERDRRKRRSNRSRDYSSEREDYASTSIIHSTERNRKHNSDPRLRQESHRNRHHRRHEYDDKYERYDKRGKSKHSSDSRRSHGHKSSSKRHSDRQQTDIKKDAPKSANPLDRQLAHDSDDSDVHSTRSIDSDPLSSLIGPQPPSKADARDPPTIPRGRGAYKVNTSNIDSHFAEEYDPSTDILPGEDDLNSRKNSRRPVAGLATEGDDWDMALEALRDRVAWKQRGAERLREAGFGDKVVERWENTKAFAGLDNCGGDGDMADVKWAKKGEGREWDRGKVVDEGGDISIKPMW